MNKGLRKKIEQKLEQLDKAIQKRKILFIDSNDESTWDLDHYSGLETKLETAPGLSRDKSTLKKKLTPLDEWSESKEEDGEE